MITAEVVHFLVRSFLLLSNDAKCSACKGTLKHSSGGPCFRCGESGIEPIASSAQINYLSDIMEALVCTEQMFRHSMNMVEDMPQMYRAQTSEFIATLIQYVPVNHPIRINHESKSLISILDLVKDINRRNMKIINLANKGQALLRDGVDWEKFVRISSWTWHIYYEGDTW